MDRIDVEDLGRANDRRNVQVTLRGRRWSNARGFVSETDVQRIAIDVAVNSDSLDAHSLHVQMMRQAISPRLGDTGSS
jgi:hypothetical protein